MVTSVDFPTPMLPAMATNFFMHPPCRRRGGLGISRQLRVDDLLEVGERVGAHQACAVDKESGRSPNRRLPVLSRQAVGKFDVRLHLLFVLVAAQALIERRPIQAKI